ncbi:MAG TPA: TonB-dependent receptor [Candidatus Acidoferrales bacterium]|nr:TonB-dependent receptor [Candidatus Acidoferrales bacterium]
MPLRSRSITLKGQECQLLLFLFTFLLLGGIAGAQVAITGKITGVVTDASGAVVPNASVAVKSTALMTSRTTKTANDGSYLFDLLPVGSYEVSITAPGFRTYVQSGIVINAGFTATVSPKLEVGQVAQTVTVTGEPAVDVKTVEATTTFDEHLLQNIPYGRDPWSTVAQTPGATLSTVDVGGNQSYQQSTMQIHGSNPGEQLFAYNGLDLNWPGSNGGFTQFYTDQDSFQEFEVVHDNSPASVPIGGVYMNMVIKSGSNTLHGLAAAYYSTAATEASPSLPTFNGAPVNAGSPIVMSRDTATNLGGPLLRNKWWLFGGYHRYDLREDILAVRLKNGQPIVDNNHQTDTDLRSDWQIGSRNRVSFVWLWNEQNRFARRSGGFQFVAQDASWVQIEPAYILEGLWTSQVTSNLLFDFRFGYNKIVFPLSAQPGVLPTAVPTEDITLSTLINAPTTTQVNPSWLYKFAVSGSYYKAAWAGTHNFKFGFETGRNVNPYHYNVNDGLNAVFNNGAPLEVIAYNTPLHLDNRFNDDAVYLSDDWTLHRRLTLNLGVRYDHWVTYWPEQVSPAATFATLFPQRTFPARGGVVDWNNVSPRIGLAFDPNGRGTSVFRFSYDRYYSIEGSQLAEAIDPNGLSTQTFLWNGATDSNGIPLTSEWLQPANFVGASGGKFTTIDPSLSRPYSDEVAAGYQRQVWQNLTLSATYYFRHFSDLIGRENLAASPSDYTAVTTLKGSPIINGVTGQAMTLYNLNPALVGKTNFFITNIPLLGNNRYDGVEFDANKRLSNRFSLLAGFTIQRQKGEFLRGGANQALGDNFNDPNLSINRANSYLNFDSTYVFKLDGTYQLPWNFGSSVNFQHYTGFPLTPTEVFRGLNQGPVSVSLEPGGVIRLPSVNLLDVRFSRTFSIADRYQIEPLVDLFNMTNAQTVVARVTSFGPAYLKPSNTVNPFLARIGLRFTF